MSSLHQSSFLALPVAMPPAARAVIALLRRLQVGTLDLQLPDGSQLHLGTGRPDEPHATLRVSDWSAFGMALRSGDIGFAEGYIDGRWTTGDLSALLRLFVANREALESLVYGRWWGQALHRLRHLLRRNSRAGSRRNIHAHYDLGNAFYRLWLDETMNYSSACFEGDPCRPMAQAQQAKMRRALQQCALRPGDRLLEVGCGWGALAELAARDHGLTVDGITLSVEQLAWGRQRLADAGLSDRAQLHLRDYRDLNGPPADGIVSIEMFEAVGQAFWPAWFEMLRRQLKPGGRACIQTITIRDDLFDRYVQGTDFIQQYIFPGGLLPSAERFRAEAERHGLQLIDQFSFGADYAETLRQWRARFLQRDREVLALGFDARFLRIWDFYLAYCEAAFDGGNTDVVQFTLVRP